MKHLKKEELIGIRKVLRFTHDRDTVQNILNVIGRENWTREVLEECDSSLLTNEQNALFESLGGYFSDEEFEQRLYSDDINEEISDLLRKQGVTPFLYQNEDYLNSIREGKVICEGIEAKQIINNYYKQINESYEEKSDF